MSWSVGVDIGGTFTDVVCAGPDGLVTFKLPTTATDRSLAAAAALERLAAEHAIPAARIRRFVHGTTVATNAVLERKGARVGLITTEGFRDTLEIGRQMRHQLYDLALKPETPGWLVPRARRVEVRERVGADGTVVTPLDESSLAEAVAVLQAADVEAVAICLLFSFLEPTHERRVAEVVRAALPGAFVSLSCEVDPAFREYERTAATCFDAYVGPAVDGYLDRMERALARAGCDAPLQVMQSRGGLAAAGVARQRPVRLLLSGPAAGVIGARRVAAKAGRPDAISIDIGGTSSDIALAEDGTVAVRQEADVGGHRIRVPMLDIVTLGAGGGSIAWIDSAGGLRVGPHSAGADPGPACYARGGEEATVTDASVVLGYLDPAYFAGGTLALDPGLAAAAVARLAARLGLEPEATALGIHRIANSQMADGIRLVSMNRGIDPRGFALVPLGGAGGIHGAALAAELGMTTMVVPRHPGVLSAAGLLSARIEHEVSGPFLTPLADTTPEAIDAALAALHAQTEELMARERTAGLETRRAASADIAYAGQSHTIEVTYDGGPLGTLYDRFQQAHAKLNGHAMDAPAKIVTLRVAHSALLPEPPMRAETASGPSLKGRRRIMLGETGAVDAEIHVRASIGPGATITGPAVIEQDDTTTLLPPGWTATADPDGSLIVEAT